MALEEQKKEEEAIRNQSLLSSLKIRTMTDDLQKKGPSTFTLPVVPKTDKPAPAAAPKPAQPAPGIKPTPPPQPIQKAAEPIIRPAPPVVMPAKQAPPTPAPKPAQPLAAVPSSMPEPPAYLPIEETLIIQKKPDIQPPKPAQPAPIQIQKPIPQPVPVPTPAPRPVISPTITPAPQASPMPQIKPSFQPLEPAPAPKPAPPPVIKPAPVTTYAAPPKPQPPPIKVEYKTPASAKIFSSRALEPALYQRSPVKKPRPFVKSLLLIVIIILVIGAAGGAYYYWLSNPGSTLTQNIQEPQPLFSMENKQVIELATEDAFALYTKISDIGQTSQIGGSFTYLLVKQPGGNGQYYTLSEILSAFGVTIPNNTFFDDLENDYSLFLYYQKENGIASNLLPSRLGLIVKTKDSAHLKQSLLNLEPSLAQNFQPLFLGQETISRQPRYIENTYQNFNIRYANLPDRYISLDYAISGAYLIITTSKESTYEVINRLGQ